MVVGGGYIGLEMAENLVHRGLDVTIVEMLGQVMAPLDPECARLVERHLEGNGVHVALGDAVAAFKQGAGRALEVHTKSGKVHPADIVILAIGVRPETALAKSAGLTIGERGGIRVDEQMRTSDPDIFAVGDAVEVKDFVTGEWTLIPLAGPANRQGRIVADVIAGRDARFRGTQGTSVIGLFGATVAMTGANEKLLVRLGQTDFEKVYLFPNSHAGYYPGARTVVLKVIFRKSDGRLLGAQGLGRDGVEKRIDALAMAIQMGATVYDLEESELCYAPPYGSAKDPVNFAGMVPADVLRGDMPLCHWEARGRRVPARRAQPAGDRGGGRPGRGQHPVAGAARAAGRTPPRPRDPGHLPLGRARLLRDAHPAAERFPGPEHLRRHAGAFDAREGDGGSYSSREHRAKLTDAGGQRHEQQSHAVSRRHLPDRHLVCRVRPGPRGAEPRRPECGGTRQEAGESHRGTHQRALSEQPGRGDRRRTTVRGIR